jgi:hypothetical protein
MATKSTALMTPLSEAKLAALREDFPVEASFTRALLPRIAFKAQDVCEGKGKAMKVLIEAGTFLLEKQEKNDEGEPVLDSETGKQVWTSEELGTEIEGVIVFQRKQLRYFDESTGSYTSSPVYDNDDEIIPLFRDKAEIDRGTPAELKSRDEYAGVSLKGKPKSKLEDNRILYVLMDDEIRQLNIRGSSMYSYMDYARKARPAVPAVLTHFSSESKENGSVSWNQMSFEAVRPLTNNKEADIVIEKQTEIKDAIAREKSFYAGQQPATPAGYGELAGEFKK